MEIEEFVSICARASYKQKYGIIESNKVLEGE
jgi:hypothetical protein